MIEMRIAHPDRPDSGRRQRATATTSKCVQGVSRFTQDALQKSECDEEQYLLKLLITLFILAVVPAAILFAILLFNPDVFSYGMSPR